MSPGLQLPPLTSTPISVLVVGPQLETAPLFDPLCDHTFHLTYIEYPPAAILALSAQTFQLVCCSTNIKPLRLLQVLEAVKHASAEQLIPIVMAVDLSQRMTTFPTFTWAGRFGLVHSQTSPAEWQALVDRLLT